MSNMDEVVQATDAGATRQRTIPTKALQLGWHRLLTRRVVRACMAISLAATLVLPLPLLASDVADDASMPDAMAPWAITALPYIADPSYNNGLVSPDGFAEGSGNNFIGRKVVQLTDGSVIVAGVVRPQLSGGHQLVNLGLVRYNASGQRMVWTNPGSYGHNAGQYVIYPKTNAFSGPETVVDVRDMAVVGDRLFILVHNRFTPTDVDALVLTFNLSGAFLARTAVAVSGTDVVAGGIVAYSNLQFPETISIAYAGYANEGGVSRPEFRHGTVNANGTITFNAIVRPNPRDYCPADRGCMLQSISGGRMPSGISRFYVAGTRYNTGAADTDFLVMALSSTGTPVTSFADNGVRTVVFNNGGTMSDSVNKVVSRFGFIGGSDTIYLIGDVAQTCKTGVGIAKLLGDGELNTAFGDIQFGGARSGKRVIGGSTSTNPINCSTLGSATHSYDADIDGNHLGIASTTFSPNNSVFCGGATPCPEMNLNGSVIVLDATTGETESFASYPYTASVGGARTRHSSFIGIAASGSGRFTVAGDTRAFQTAPGAPAGMSQYASMRVRPVDDVIFRSGFDSN